MTKTFGSTVLRSLLLVCIAWALSCTKSEKAPRDEGDAEARRRLLQNLTEHVIVATYTDFAARAAELEAKSKAYAERVSGDERDAARAAWKAAMRVWQRAEMLQVGPAARVSDAAPGGQGLRDLIYAWPVSFPCGLDRALVQQSYRDSLAYAENNYPNVRGLGAMESLLFDPRTETVCLTDDTVVTSQAWSDLSSELEQRRAAFAYSLAQDVKRQADALVLAWKNGFAVELTKAGDGSSEFKRTQDALNAVSDALFYLDTETKDMKVATPAGISEACMDSPCPERVEHPFAKVSKDSILANLEAFRDVFRGLPPEGKRGDQMWGFRDLLLSVSAEVVAKDIDALIDDSLTAVQAIDGGFEEAVERGDAQVETAYVKVQDLCARLKSDFLVALSLNRPMSAASDQD